MLFRPEEIHAASSRPPGHFSCQSLGEWNIHVSYGRWWADFEYLIVTHADADRLPTIQATGVDLNLRTGEKPAHGQHLDSSLAVPLLFPLDRYTIMCRYIGKRSPGLDIVCVLNKPAGYGGPGCLVLRLPGLFWSHSENFRKLGIVRCPPSLHKILHDSCVSSLYQCVLHITASFFCSIRSSFMSPCSIRLTQDHKVVKLQQ